MSKPDSSLTSTTQSIKVALYNHNGLVGSSLLKYLKIAHQASKIQLVILHRPGSKLDSIYEGDDVGKIETRVIYMDEPEGHEQENIEVVEDLNIVVSAASIPGSMAQLSLIKALAHAPNLKVYFPSVYGPIWTEDETSDPRLQFLTMRDQLDEEARKLGVPLCLVKCGQFPEWGFTSDHGVCFMDIRENKLNVAEGWREAVMPITPVPYLAASIVNLLVNHPDELAGKTYHSYSSEPTGQEIYNIFKRIHNGTEPTVITQTHEQLEALLDKGAMNAVLAACITKWARNKFATWQDGVHGGERIFPGEEFKEDVHDEKVIRDQL